MSRSKEDLTGKKINEWTVLGKGYQNYWIVRCSCGYEQQLEKWVLTSREQKSCNNCSRKKYRKPLEIGLQINRLTILSNFVKNGISYCECKCQCGKILNIRGDGLRKGITKGCRNCAKRNDTHGDISSSFWCNIKNGAKSRKLKFDITREYIWQLFLKQDKRCALSNVPITLEKSGKNLSTKNSASLDRIDSSKGYIEGNVQWVHKRLNLMKLAASNDLFIDICNLVSQQHNRDITADSYQMPLQARDSKKPHLSNFMYKKKEKKSNTGYKYISYIKGKYELHLPNKYVIISKFKYKKSENLNELITLRDKIINEYEESN